MYGYFLNGKEKVLLEKLMRNYEEVKNLEMMKMYHMSVIYDKSTNKLVYDRKLKPGAGESMYGLEVCKSLTPVVPLTSIRPLLVVAVT